MLWKDISMGERLRLLKDRRASNPTYSYFNLRSEYDDGKDPLGSPAQYSYDQPKLPNVDYSMPIQAAQIPNMPTITQQITMSNSNSPVKAVDYTQYLPSAQEYNENNWSLPTYDNTKYVPSQNIRKQIRNWEGSSMRTNAPIDTKAKELKNILGSDLINHLNQDQMDSLTSYYYNIMPSSFTPTLKQLKRLPTVKSKDEYNNVLRDVSKTINVGYNRKGMSGLARRRTVEQMLFLYGH
jgi:GH24 family phage-related lysozyme (muramidase)